MLTLVPTSKDEPQTWRFTTADPGDGWFTTEFDDQKWRQAPGPFGARDRGFKPRTAWRTDDIWLRRTFTLTAMQGTPALLMCHEQGADVYINGVPAVTSPGGSSKSYAVFPLSPESIATLRPDDNTIAVHVHHEDFEAHFIDVGLVDVQRSDK
jgi:beta-galactosidase